VDRFIDLDLGPVHLWHWAAAYCHFNQSIAASRPPPMWSRLFPDHAEIS